MAKERLVPLTPNLDETPGFPLKTCNSCEDHESEAVMALEHAGKVHRFYGLCGNHAEVLGVGTHWQTVGQRANRR